jgi:crotonobetainyl-CoA:carnitine CoA-transferase CaiB-like acyl-CoA transferase
MDQEESRRMKPLEGVRILTVEQFGAGPYGSLFLADLGAEVIKIENAETGGDAARHVGPRFLGEADSEYFQSMNSNKRSITLDLKSEEGRQALRRLAVGADAVMNNLRGDQPEKLGLDYPSLSAVNPAIVCVHLSAYGRDNARADWPGYDFLMQAEAGLMSLTGDPEAAPARTGTSMIDCMAGMTAAAALLAALHGAKRTGKGCDVDTSLFEVALHQLGYAATWYLNGGEAATRQPRGAHLSLTPVQTFPSADGWIFVMCMHDRFWEVLARELGRADLLADPKFASQAARLEHRGELTRVLDAEFRRARTGEWLARLSGKVPVAPVNDLAQALANPFVAEIGMVAGAPHPERPDFRVLASPVKIDGERPRPTVCKP